MVEPVIYLGLGFLLASLLAVLSFPVVHRRAARLTKRRLEAAMPFSLAEMQADKDQLRAEFAMANRRLEMMLESVKEREAAQMAELGQKTEAVSRLKAEVDAKTATVAGLESTVKRLTDNLTAATDEMEIKRAAQADAEREAAELRAKLAEAENRYGESAMAGDRQRIEMVALQTQLATVKDRLADAERALAASEAHLQQGQTGLQGTRVEADLRNEIARLQRHYEGATAALRADKLQLEGQLERVRQERDKLQRDLGNASRGMGSAAPDGGEAALLRERVSDVAAEIARLAAALEGPDSPIETIMRRELGAPAKGNGASDPAAEAAAETGKAASNLADRIRALQGRAARVSSQS